MALSRMRAVTGPGATSFGRYLLAFGITGLGDGIFLTAVPLIALDAYGDPFAVALCGIAAQLPWLFALMAGAYADRADRSRILFLADALRAALFLVGGIVILVGDAAAWTLATVLFLSAANSVGRLFYEVAVQGAIIEWVDDLSLELANSRISVVSTMTTMFLGPPIGALVVMLDPSVPLLTNAVAFTVGASLIYTGIFHTRRDQAGRSPAAHRTGDGAAGPPLSRRAAREGFVWIWRSPSLRSLAVTSAAAALLTSMAFSVFVVLVVEAAGGTEWSYGLVITVEAVGGLAGGWLAGRVGRPRWLGGNYSFSVLLGTGGLTIMVEGAHPYVPLIGVMAFFGGLSSTIWFVRAATLRQRLTPAHLASRVGGAFRAAGVSMVPLGQLLGGGWASALGVRSLYLVVGGALFLLAALAGPTLRRAQAVAAQDPQSVGPGIAAGPRSAP